MLFEVLRYLNLFKYGADDNLVKEVRRGCFKFENGSIILPNVKNGMYIAVIGSDLNDGAYQMPFNGFIDETFNGTVYILRNDRAFFNIVDDISEWCAKNNTPSAFTSESFGGYSYSRATSANGNAATWKNAFEGRLKPWKKV